MAIYTPADPRSRFLGKLRQYGVPEHALTAIDWNAQDESSWNPTASGDNGNAFGILQWNGPRKVALMQFAKAVGRDPGDPELQADFFWREANGPEKAAWDATLAAPDPGSAAATFVRQFERPAKSHMESRAAKYTGGGMGQGGVTMSSSGGGGALGMFPEQDFPGFTKADKIRTALAAFGEGMTALGGGRGTNFAATDAFVDRLRLERMAQAKPGAPVDLTTNATIQQLQTLGRPDLAQSVANGGLTAEDALKEAYKTATKPGQELSEPQLAVATQLRREFDAKAAPLAAIELAAGNVLKFASDPGSASDAVLLQQFAKMLDPTSVVREGEVAYISQAAGGLESYLRSWQAALDPETGKLSGPARQQLIDMTNQLLGAARTQLGGYQGYYTDLAKRQGISPDWIGHSPAQGAPTAAGPGAGPTPPAVAVPTDEELLRM